MKKIAITGVIASGKSEVCKIIESLGEEVIYTDKINNELLNDKDYQQKLLLIFPNCIKNDKVDKSLIRQEILQNDDKRKALNSLAHAEIKLKVEKIMQKINKKTIFVEIPLIVESNMVEYFDEIWCVVTDYNTKVDRIIERDKVTEKDAEKIIDTQKKDSELIAISNKVIHNNGNLNKLEEEVKELVCTMIK